MKINHINNNLSVFKSDESFLGSRKKRYFSSSYKKINCDIKELIIQNNSLLGNLSIAWPEVWSEKNGELRKPHLGSLELYVIAVRFVEHYLGIIDNLKKECIEKVWVNNFVPKVGQGAIENCHELACRCSKLSQRQDKNRINCLFEVKIGKATVRLAIDYNLCEEKRCFAGCVANPCISIQKLLDLRVHDERSFYTTGYKIPVHKITDIIVNKEEQSVRADIELLNIELSPFFNGLSKAYQPCLTFCDIILVTGQLAQILLFSLDNINREEAGNLWMRTADCKYFRPIKENTGVKISVKESSMLKTGGIEYRAATLLLDFNDGDSLSECKFAYQITEKL